MTQAITWGGCEGEPVRVGIRERVETEVPYVVGDHPSRPRYIVYDPQTGDDWAVFGTIQGGETREEAVFWAERFASKNGVNYAPPEGWDDVVGALPPKEPP